MTIFTKKYLKLVTNSESNVYILNQLKNILCIVYKKWSLTRQGKEYNF